MIRLVMFLSVLFFMDECARSQEDDSIYFRSNVIPTTVQIKNILKYKSARADTDLYNVVHDVLKLFDRWESEGRSLADTQLQGINVRSRVAFIEGQKRWFAYRDAEEMLAYEMSGGSSRTSQILTRRIELTQNRVKDLKNFLETRQ